MPRRSGRMTKQWLVANASDQFIMANNTVGAFGGINFSGAGTILRTLGEYIIAPTAAPVAADSAVIGVGVIVIGEDNFASGTASTLPEPIEDGEAPWLYRMVHPLFFGGTDPQSGNGAAYVRQLVDVKTMRRVRGDQTLGVIVQYSDVTGTPPLTWTMGSFRYLLAT